MFLRVSKEELINTTQCSYLKFEGYMNDEWTKQQLRIFIDQKILIVDEEKIYRFVQLNHKLIPKLHLPVREALLYALKEAGITEWEVDI